LGGGQLWIDRSWRKVLRVHTVHDDMDLFTGNTAPHQICTKGFGNGYDRIRAPVQKQFQLLEYPEHSACPHRTDSFD